MFIHSVSLCRLRSEQRRICWEWNRSDTLQHPVWVTCLCSSWVAGTQGVWQGSGHLEHVNTCFFVKSMQHWWSTVTLLCSGVNMYAMLTGCLPYTVEPFNITALHAKMLENKMNPIPENLSSGEFTVFILVFPCTLLIMANACLHLCWRLCLATDTITNFQIVRIS